MEEFLKQTWVALTNASPIAAMVCFLFLLRAWRDVERERTERLTLQKECNELRERVLNGLHAATASISSVTAVAESIRVSVATLLDRFAYRRGGGDPGE